MIRRSTDIKITLLVVALGLPLVLSEPAYAATAGVANVENFIAMKLMNEIQSDIDGIIAKVFVENAQPVEYGQPLFGIKV